MSDADRFAVFNPELLASRLASCRRLLSSTTNREIGAWAAVLTLVHRARGGPRLRMTVHF